MIREAVRHGIPDLLPHGRSGWFAPEHPYFQVTIQGGYGVSGSFHAVSAEVVSAVPCDAKGEAVKDRPGYPADLIASSYELLGIDPHAKLPHPQGIEVHATPSEADGLPTGGRLKEIM